MRSRPGRSGRAEKSDRAAALAQGPSRKSKRFEQHARGARAIIVAAERLFGKFGLDGVSLRQIVAAAGQVNPSAVQHHFGSKRGLIKAVYQMRTPLIEAARRAKLDAMRKRESIEDLLGALLEPIIERLPKASRLLYARFMMRLLPLSDAEHPHFSCLDMCAPSVEIMRRMSAHFPKLSEEIVKTRARMAVAVFLQGICDERRVRVLASHAYGAEETFWDEIFQMSLSIFYNPYPPPPRFGVSISRAPGARPVPSTFTHRPRRKSSHAARSRRAQAPVSRNHGAVDVARFV